MTGPVPALPRAIGLPASWLYGGVVAARNAMFGTLRTPVRLPVPVVSIGNITVGGTGKTPMVHWVVEQLAAAGRHPAICLRGYGGAGGADEPASGARLIGVASDEALEHATAFPEAVVVASPDRARAMRGALADFPELDCVVVDDGFQHRQLGRDLDVVLVDAARPALDDALLPAGWLREPAAALARADAVVVTHADAVDEALSRRIESLHGAAPIAWTRHAWRAVRRYEPGPSGGVAADGAAGVTADDVAVVEGTAQATDALRDQRLVVMAGIGRPETVVTMAEACGAVVVDVLRRRDHAAYAARDVDELSAAVRAGAADAVLVTRKDWTKLAPVLAGRSAWTTPVLVPHLGLDFVAGESALRSRVQAAVAVGAHAGDDDGAARGTSVAGARTDGP